MIFTIGHTKSYNAYFKEQGTPKKAVGGSVWKTFKKASQHCLKGYSVYGVRADWKKDTSKGIGDWHDLLTDAPLTTVNK